MELIQKPEAGRKLLLFAGDILEFRLESSGLPEGNAFLRTNIGNNFFRISEIAEHGEKGIPPPGQDWRDYPMERVDKFTFSLKLRLTEVGHFEAKCFLTGKNHEGIFWPEGENTRINVEPAPHAAFNSIYCAFVRQFGENIDREKRENPPGIPEELLEKLDSYHYTVIPPSGTFRSLRKKLDHIFDTLHCRILHLLPIHPTPTVYGKMGRFGSPYAALDFTAVNPEYAEFDREVTVLDQFEELVDAVHRKGGKLFLDIAINHTGWAAKLHETNPQWLVREKNGAIHSPGAWGVVWADLTELDHSIGELWQYLANVFRIWCLRGVDGFRCDAGYMIPREAWEYIIAKVRAEFPETIFLLEGLGGDPAITHDLLDTANMDWAYSELFQNYSREQIQYYLAHAWKESRSVGLMVHYAETHDNNRLAATSREYAVMRTALAALTSDSGSFGFTNGVEWFAEEKIDVHENSALNWGAEPNQIKEIAQLNSLLAHHKAFGKRAHAYFIESGSPEGLLLCRTASDGSSPLLIAVNLNTEKGITLGWNPGSVPFDTLEVWDIFAGRKTKFLRETPQKVSLRLAGGQIAVFSPEKWVGPAFDSLGSPTLEQESARCALEILSILEKTPVAGPEEDPVKLGKKLLASPEGFFREIHGGKSPPDYVLWNYPEDTRRCVMVPPGTFLLIHSPVPFRAWFAFHGKVASLANSLPRKEENGKTAYFAILSPPLEKFSSHTEGKLNFIFYGEKAHHGESPLLFLAEKDETITTFFTGTQLQKGNFRYFRGNGRGACIYQNILPGELPSRYDALLLANFHDSLPVDRSILLRNFRIYLISRHKTWQAGKEFLESFYIASDKSGIWSFLLPAGNGVRVRLLVKAEIKEGENTLLYTVFRPEEKNNSASSHLLEDDEKITILLRPDLEDRSYHGETRSSMGPESCWPERVEKSKDHLLFAPAENRFLSITPSRGQFHISSEWSHIFQKDEAARGLEPYTDLFSPGFFAFSLEGGEMASFLIREMTREPQEISPEEIFLPKKESFLPGKFSTEALLEDSMAQFVVKRENLKSVIAGYPWFLDWGRDTLIAARGLLSSPRFREDVKAILLNFASFGENGTIPNMICGEDAGNRDTSDAPLWLFVLTRDLCRMEKKSDFLHTPLPGKFTLLDALEDLVQNLLSGTPNGIQADPESLLLFSPAHFSWMDTNYPAGTPREGYPVEIQALWYNALLFLGEELPGEKGKGYREMAEKVRTSFLTFFPLPGGYLSDCLHGRKGTPAREANPDDHLRCNALYAITLGLLQREKDLPIMESLLRETASLLIPGAIRTLRDGKVEFPLPICDSCGNLLNSPCSPYEGRYEGNEDSCRKKAYHNGTAWTLPFPLYSESLYLTYGKNALSKARIFLSGSFHLFRKGGCIGELPEILDGDCPHTFRGCQAQAWGITELYRVWKLLQKELE